LSGIPAGAHAQTECPLPPLCSSAVVLARII
jgi:hypothetical protein